MTGASRLCKPPICFSILPCCSLDVEKSISAAYLQRFTLLGSRAECVVRAEDKHHSNLVELSAASIYHQK